MIPGKPFLYSVLAAVVGALPTNSSLHLDNPEDQPPVAYPIGQVNWANAKVAGRLFDLDGKVDYFAGSNAWWLAHLSENSDIDIALSEVAKTKYKVLRVWGFGDVNTPPPASNTDPNRVYFRVLNATGSYINYGADGLQRLDYAVHAAERHGVRLVLNFVNNWSDYGGIAAYTAAFGAGAASATGWFTDAASQAAYANYAEVLVRRYRRSPAVFAWELANEPRCAGCDPSVLTRWAAAASARVKRLDPDRLVTLGDEGWFASLPSSSSSSSSSSSPGSPAQPSGRDDDGDGSYYPLSPGYDGSAGVDWVANLAVPTLDYGTFHLYPDSWGYNYSWGDVWIRQHDEAGRAAGKPVVLEEYGAPFPGNHTPYYKPWQDAVLGSGVAADQVWQFGTYDLSVPGPDLGDVNSIYFNDTEYKVLGFEHAAAMLNKKVNSSA